MKVIFVCSIFVFIFINISSGLKCYECNDYISGFECNHTTSFFRCHKKYELCATYYYKNEEHPYLNCGERDRCVQKHCARHTYDHCERSGTFEVVDVDEEHFTVDCCKGDLCNRPSSAQYVNHNVLLFPFSVCICVFIRFCS